MASLLRNVSFLIWGNKKFTKGGYERAAKDFDNRWVCTATPLFFDGALTCGCVPQGQP